MGNFTTGCMPEGPGKDVEEHNSRLTTLVAALFSAVVGGEVSLDGKNADRDTLHPESMCVFRFLRATTSEQDGPHITCEK